MKKITILIVLLCLSWSSMLIAQQSKSFRIPRAAVLPAGDVQEDWAPVVQTIEQPVPGGDAARLRAIKEELAKKYPKRAVSVAKQTLADSVTPVSPPYVAHNFAGNGYASSTPNDNAIAISNGNKIVSVQNTNVFRYNANTWTAQGTTSLSGFFGTLGNPQGKYDPKVIYDPIEDKFVILTLAGYTDSTSSILVGFSQTNDPTGAWNLYTIPGEPLGDTTWTDFPMISLTNNEVFITVNHLYNDMSWQLGFKRTVIWQIKKSNGYLGQPLDLMLNFDINYNGKPLRNLCPVVGGSTLYGPDMYFLSERNLQPTNDSVFLVHLSDTAGSPNFSITVTPLVSNIAYFVPPSANQPTLTGKWATNDSRVLGAIFEDGMIQYVQNTMDTTSGKAAVIHGVISNLTDSIPTIHAHLIIDSILEFGYPNLSYAGNGPGDSTTFISFLHSSSTVYPGFSCMTWTGSQYSPIQTVINGQGYINVLQGDERWGDYSGSQRKYNNTGEVWISGMYGKVSGLNHWHATWIAQLGTSVYLGQKPWIEPRTEVSTFPNPFLDRFEVMFTLENSEVLRFELYDMQGKFIKLLLYDKVKAGTNRFSFNTGLLAKGTYLLSIQSDSRQITSKQIIKE